jgi:hypothetical protein
MTPASIIVRLREQCAELHLVGGAAQLARAIEALTTVPAAFVLPARETAADSPFLDQIVQQEIRAEFTVVLAVRNLADDAGSAAREELEPVRAAVRMALLGWVPDAAASGCEFVGGELAQFKDSLLWWADTYSTSYLIRSA